MTLVSLPGVLITLFSVLYLTEAALPTTSSTRNKRFLLKTVSYLYTAITCKKYASFKKNYIRKHISPWQLIEYNTLIFLLYI